MIYKISVVSYVNKCIHGLLPGGINHAKIVKNIENAKKASEQYGIEKYTDNEDDIILDKSIDAIDICTPNIYHYKTY